MNIPLCCNGHAYDMTPAIVAMHVHAAALCHVLHSMIPTGVPCTIRVHGKHPTVRGGWWVCTWQLMGAASRLEACSARAGFIPPGHATSCDVVPPCVGAAPEYALCAPFSWRTSAWTTSRPTTTTARPRGRPATARCRMCRSTTSCSPAPTPSSWRAPRRGCRAAMRRCWP